MILEKFKEFFSRKLELSNRNFEPRLLLSDVNQQIIQDLGFVHLRNIVSVEHINQLLDVYKQANEKYCFVNKAEPFFLNTMALTNHEAKRFIQQLTTPIVNKILEQILIKENISTPFGAAYCINPPNTQRTCKSHQDPAYVDELKTYSLIVWIPLTNIDKSNGCLHVLPKSHLWGNHTRSISMEWIFEPFSEELFNQMLPIATNVGDIIIFDGSLIHASNGNMTEQERLAINIPVLPKGEQMITYFKESKRKGYKYEIDDGYYMDEYLIDRPSDKFNKVSEVNFKNKYSEFEVRQLLDSSK